MKVSSFILNVTSEQPDRLKQFYRDTVQLEPNLDMGEVGAFKVGEGAAKRAPSTGEASSRPSSTRTATTASS